MSFTDRLMLWFHVAFAIFTVGPVTMVTMATPRYIRARNVPVLRYLLRMTRIFGAGSLLVLALGMALGQSLNELGEAWLTAALTLYVVALVLLVLIMRDQRRAIVALETAASDEALAAAATAAGSTPQPEDEPVPGTGEGAGQQTPAQAGQAAMTTASVERGRIASMAGVVSVLWLVILVLMVWNSGS